jgi:hypothetical protein
MTYTRILSLALAALPVLALDLSEDLLAASRKGDVAAVKSLLDKGADVNAKSPYGSTPLFFACDRGYTEIVKLLVDRGADVNVEDTFYHATALRWAAQKSRLEIMRLLLDKGAKSPEMVLAMGSQMGNAQFVKMALDVSKGSLNKGAMSNALQVATRANKTEIVDMLKAAGAVMPEAPKVVELDASVLQSYAGTYLGGRGGTEFEFVFIVKGKGLSGAFGPQPSLTYLPSDQTHFHAVEVNGINLEFKPPDGLTLTQGSAVIDFKKKVAK